MTTVQQDLNGHVDLRLLDYVTEVDRNLLCPICHCPFVEPARLPCDHSFCRHCLSRTFQAQTQDTKTCPTCRVSTDEATTASVPRFLIHLIDDLPVRCPKHSAGCMVQLRRGDVESHLNHYCDYVNVPCPDKECSMEVQRHYKGRECPHVVEACDKCKTPVMKGELEKHLKERCSNTTVQCGGCKAQIARHELVEHIATCTHIETHCAAKDIGCKYNASRTKVKIHEADCVLAALLPAWQTMDQTVRNQKTTIQGLQRRNFDLEAGVAALQSLLGDVAIAGQSSIDRTQSTTAVSTVIREVSASNAASEIPSFDSATHHLLSLHESLREEVDRLSGAVSALDAKSSMIIMNESLHIKEDLAHTNAVIGLMRMQLQWLTSARLQAMRSPVASTMPASSNTAPQSGRAPPAIVPGPVRRLSDSTKQDLKL